MQRLLFNNKRYSKLALILQEITTTLQTSFVIEYFSDRK